MKPRTIIPKPVTLGLLASIALLSSAAQGQILAVNFGDDMGRDGDGGFTKLTQAATAGWTTEPTSLRHTSDTTSAWYNHVGSTKLPSLSGGGTDFEIELTFQWNQLGDGSTFRRIGVAFLGNASNDDLATGDDYYAALFYPLQGDHGQLRLQNSVEGGTVATNVSRTLGFGGAASSNEVFTLSLTGTYNLDGDLTIAFSVSDAEGGGSDVLSTTITAASAFSGEHFGIVGRTRHNDTVDYQTFTIIPEPSTYAALAGLLALGLVIVRRRAAFQSK